MAHGRVTPASSAKAVSLLGVWLCETDALTATAEAKYLAAVAANHRLVETVLKDPLLGLVFSHEDGDEETDQPEGISVRRIGGTPPGFPPARLERRWNVTYGEAGRQWSRLVVFDPLAEVMAVERVGPTHTFPRILETFRTTPNWDGAPFLERTIDITDAKMIRTCILHQRFHRPPRSASLPSFVVQSVMSEQRILSHQEVECKYGAMLGNPVLIIGVEDRRCKPVVLVSPASLRCSPSSTYHTYLIGNAANPTASGIVERRYSDFAKLRTSIAARCHERGPLAAKVLSALPPKTLYPLRGRSLCYRREGLQRFLEALVAWITVTPGNEYRWMDSAGAFADADDFLGVAKLDAEAHAPARARRGTSTAVRFAGSERLSDAVL